jgi:hypothetical protein
MARHPAVAADGAGCDSVGHPELHREFLATMPGSRRATVSLIERVLQRAELIRHLRGRVEIIDRGRLERAVCCLEIVGPKNRDDRGSGNQKVVSCCLVELCHVASPLVLGAPR